MIDFKIKMIATVALAIAIPFTASAATMVKGHHDVSVVVSTEAYNLSSDAGQEMLYDRLRSAARQVCGTTNLREAGSLEQALQNRACIRNSLSQAVEDVNHRGLKSLHENS